MFQSVELPATASLIMEDCKTLPCSLVIAANNDVIIKTTDGVRSNEEVIKVDLPGTSLVI